MGKMIACKSQSICFGTCRWSGRRRWYGLVEETSGGKCSLCGSKWLIASMWFKVVDHTCVVEIGFEFLTKCPACIFHQNVKKKKKNFLNLLFIVVSVLSGKN